MSGYNYKKNMSNNAVDAYENGEKPFDEWTRDELIEAVIDYCNNAPYVWFDIDNFLELSTRAMRICVLSYSSWHHISRKYIETDFYFIDKGKIAAMTNKSIKDIKEYCENNQTK